MYNKQYGSPFGFRHHNVSFSPLISFSHFENYVFSMKESMFWGKRMKQQLQWCNNRIGHVINFPGKWTSKGQRELELRSIGDLYGTIDRRISQTFTQWEILSLSLLKSVYKSTFLLIMYTKKLVNIIGKQICPLIRMVETRGNNNLCHESQKARQSTCFIRRTVLHLLILIH